MSYDRVTAFLLENTPEVTDEVVDYYRKHPDELALITDKEAFHVKFPVPVFWCRPWPRDWF